MSRETSLRFGAVPRIHQNRSKIDMTHTIKATWNNGELIPLDRIEVLPGDTLQIDMSCLVRMATPIYPVLDNMWCDIYWFFIPRRLTWEHWEEFWGQNDNEWIQTQEYAIPQIEAPSGGWAEGTIADYMGIPTYKDNISIDAQYFRSYAKVYSDWFRSENLQKSAHYYTDETTRTGSNGTNYITDCEKGGMPAKINRLMDVFSGALPEPQKGPDVAIPLGTSANVTGTVSSSTTIGGNISSQFSSGGLHPVGALPFDWQGDELPAGMKNNIKFQVMGSPAPGDSNRTYRGFLVGTGIADEISYNLKGNLDEQITTLDATKNFNMYAKNLAVAMNNDQVEITNTNNLTASTTSTPNLIADLSNATAATINELRTAFAIQKYYEAAALYGTRYIEMLRGVFGVESSDARLQRSEYLGGTRFMINMNQIVQTSSTDATSPQGNVSGMSCTNFIDSCFTKSFEEHGIVLCLMATRVEHSYQQGIDKIFSRKKWLDFYNPYFANLGNQPILNKEIYAQGSNVINPDTGVAYDEEVFGYQEAWYDYRMIPNRIVGHMRSNSPTGSLDAWTYVDNYEEMPYLSADWLAENTDNVDNTIAVTSQLANQMWGDFRVRTYATRCMPTFSMPGLIDHV